MSYFISPYRFNNGGPEDRLGPAVILSAAFHLLAAGLIIYVLPNLFIRQDRPKIIEDPLWIVDIPGDTRTGAFDELLIDPSKASQDEGQVTKNADQPKPQPAEPVKAAEPTVTVEDFVVSIGDIKDKPDEEPKEIVRFSDLPVINTPVVQPEPESAIKSGEDEAGGGGRSISVGPAVLPPEMAAYYGRIRGIISRNWTRPSETFASDIVAVYSVTIEPDGQMSQVELMTSSGNERYDASVLRAIARSIYLPELPPVFGGRTIKVGLQFRLSDMLMAAPRVESPAADDLPANGFF